jgi:hypothetical protein
MQYPQPCPTNGALAKVALKLTQLPPTRWLGVCGLTVQGIWLWDILALIMSAFGFAISPFPLSVAWARQHLAPRSDNPSHEPLIWLKLTERVMAGLFFMFSAHMFSAHNLSSLNLTRLCQIGAIGCVGSGI